MLHGFVHGLLNLGLLGGRGAVRFNALCPCIARSKGWGRKGADTAEKNSARNQKIHARTSIMPFVFLTGRPSCSFITILPIVRQIAHQSIWMGKGCMPHSMMARHDVAAMAPDRFSHKREYIFCAQ
ncbi:hypothetical protein KUA08_13145 [Komagataeibacter melomenusus]|uniref:hypothetical protein n=1 Tax=Komagataeibacter melomenusus TaxID=2766578 RepID=UPI00155459AF|nr:hypothetical protein [Komagataeibacter melomenusus]MBV1831537.1 hypothetical protein [Komagataeibacter melomenusus]